MENLASGSILCGYLWLVVVVVIVVVDGCSGCGEKSDQLKGVKENVADKGEERERDNSGVIRIGRSHFVSTFGVVQSLVMQSRDSI